MNISQDDIIVCYDTKGLFSAPFVWFTFKIFGSNSVFVFNGNLENWQKINGQFDSTKYEEKKQPVRTNLIPFLKDCSKIISYSEILKISNDIEHNLNSEYQIIDARTHERFCGNVHEPREGNFS